MKSRSSSHSNRRTSFTRSEGHKHYSGHQSGHWTMIQPQTIGQTLNCRSCIAFRGWRYLYFLRRGSKSVNNSPKSESGPCCILREAIGCYKCLVHWHGQQAVQVRMLHGQWRSMVGIQLGWFVSILYSESDWSPMNPSREDSQTASFVTGKAIWILCCRVLVYLDAMLNIVMAWTFVKDPHHISGRTFWAFQHNLYP